MKHSVYAIYDSVTEQHTLPFYAANDSDAERLVSTQLSLASPNSAYLSFPEDYMLVYIGQYDDNTAVHFDCTLHRTLCSFVRFVGEGGLKDGSD